MSDVTQLTGSPVMWLFSGLIVAAAIFQSVVLYRLARGYVRRTGVLTEQEMRVCLKAGGTVATAAQTAVGARMGTRRSEFAGVAGIVASVAVNFAVLIGVVLFGNFILSVLPAAVVDALAYALPSVYGSLLVVFIARLKR